ncbi:MAG TPA: portal protein [Terriglobales bacterium]|nr:portal protein [Terriglobales bacterium]
MKPQHNASGTPAKKGPTPEQLAAQKDRAFIDLALKRWKASADATADWRREALEDFKFRIGQQWPEEVKRRLGKKVALTINRTAAFCNQVTNEQRQQRPSATINPVGSDSDPETAEILQGIVRHIEVQCDAEVADDISFEHMVIGGLGWLRYWSEYEDDDPDNPWAQEIKIGAVPNPFTVYDDPNARHPLRIDAKWRFFVEDMPIEEYTAQYGKDMVAASSLEQFKSTGDTASQWISKDVIRIAEYYHIEYTEETLYQLQDGSTVVGLEKLPEGAKIANTRKRQKPKVMWTLMNAMRKLEEHEVPGKVIPSVPVLGYNLNVDGKPYLAGLVRTAKDPARAYNYHLSKATDMVAIAPKMPFIATARQTEGFEREWQSANTGDLAVLHYNPDPQAPERPQRETAEPPIQAMSQLLVTADTDMKAVTGLFDPSLGQKTPDQSGKAIVALQRQGNVATANFSDNLARSKRELIRGILTWIPIIYDAPRVQRIIKPDGTVDHVGIYNSKGGDPQEAQQQAQEALQDALDAKAIKKIYNIGVGRYDVTVDVGPSFQTKRQQAAAEIQQLIAAYPEMLHVCGDLMVGQMDIPLAKEIAERIKRTIPPNILGPEDGSDPEETLARMQSELSTLMQQHQQLATELKNASQIIQTKQVEQQGKLATVKEQEASRQAIARLQAETQVTVAEITTKAQAARERLQWEIDQWKILHQSAHEVGMQAVDQEHEQGMAAQQAVTQADSQQSDQDHEADMTAQGQQHEQQMAQQAQENQPEP